jgi:hypothetical protein
MDKPNWEEALELWAVLGPTIPIVLFFSILVASLLRSHFEAEDRAMGA